MKPNWIGVGIVVITGIFLVTCAFDGFGAPYPAEFVPIWEERYEYEQVARIERIDLELRMIANEKARLEQESKNLQKERNCTVKAKNRAAMKECARRTI